MSRREPTSIDRFFDQLRAEYGDTPVWWMGDIDTRLRSRHAAVDLVERDDDYVVVVDLPGYEKTDVDVRVRGRRLVVSAERERGAETEDGGRYLRQERRRATVREVEFPSDVLQSEIEATMANGVLTATVPKAEPGEAGHHVTVE